MKKLIVILLCAGCTHIYIPNTPEAMACVRECMSIRNQCEFRCYGPNEMQCRMNCDWQERQCNLTCPGAYEK